MRELKWVKREFTKIAIVSSAIYFGISYLAFGVGFVVSASFSRHQEPENAHLLSDEPAMTGTVPFQRIAADQLRVKMDTEGKVVYLNRF